MLLPNCLIQAKFLERPNRFTVKVQRNSKIFLAHLNDPGRLKELLIPGATMFLASVQGNRKTGFSVVLVRTADRCLVSLDSTLPNRILKEALSQNRFKQVFGKISIASEQMFHKSRFDFLLTSSHLPGYSVSSRRFGIKPKKQVHKIWIEVKSVTLIKDHIALFPDAPTKRGVRHLEELINLKQNGDRACLFFVIQRNDACVFAPNKTIDPIFARTLRKAVANGVELYAFLCRVTLEQVALSKPIPVQL